MQKLTLQSTFRDLSYENLSDKDIYNSPDFKKWYSLMAGKIIKKLKTNKICIKYDA